MGMKVRQDARNTVGSRKSVQYCNGMNAIGSDHRCLSVNGLSSFLAPPTRCEMRLRDDSWIGGEWVKSPY